MKLFIKNMISLCCKLYVKEQLTKLGLHVKELELGYAEISEEINPTQREKLKINLEMAGLELFEVKTEVLAEKIEKLVVELIQNPEHLPTINYSDYISKKLNYDYTYLSNTFSKVKGLTIQKFIIINKIEKVKEFLFYDELKLSEISYRLQYSSVSHLSSQFKKITGLTPSSFKRLGARSTSKMEEV